MATLRCGLSCEHCLAVSHEAGFGDMPIERVRGLIDEVATMGMREFLVTGGEPLARPDLSEVIEYVGSRGVNWSLNTAAMPGASLREVMARHRPGFVAVSLDGPKQVHDGFRGKAGAYEEATEAIRFYKSLGVRVCAGTTVTSHNCDYLDETFHLVVAGGADQWGIHLLVPEGKAADRPDLFLSKSQLKRLIKFVARKRQYFRVEMADEIGYLGYLEPLVRDIPLSCGAGRAQCVVLPDGHVVPCTTLDRSCSAGNIHERPLARIWAEGFQDLRSWRPEGKCARCDYSPACRGGCWLQRKSGTQCFKEVWHVPGALKTAAGIAICLGGLATPGNSEAAPMTQPANASLAAAAAAPATLDQAIMNYYVDQVTGLTTPLPTGIDVNDPGWEFVRDFKEGTLPQDMSERCLAVRNALETQQRSLSLIALSWRAVSEPLFDANSTAELTEAQRQTIGETLATISQKAQQWRLDIFEQNLDPYLTSGRQTYPSHCMASKAGGAVCIYDETYYLSKDVNQERWGVRAEPETREAAEAYVLEHHYADQMDLTCIPATASRARAIAVTDDESTTRPDIEISNAESITIGVFDVIKPAADVVLVFQLEGDIKGASPTGLSDEELLKDGMGESDLSTAITVLLQGGREYTYAEVLGTAYQQRRDTLLRIASDWVSVNWITLWNQNTPVVTSVYRNGALLWPAFKEIIESDGVILTNPPSEDPRENHSVIYRQAMLKDTDFWMF